MATRAEWAKRVDRWQKSGLSAEDFAKRAGIERPKQLVWWRWKLRSSPPSPPPIQFLPVRVVDAAPPLVSASSAAPAIEVVLPNGRVVRVPPGFEPAMLESVLSIAAGGAPC